MDVAREAPLARAAINHRAVIAPAGEARGLKPCPGPGEGADRQKILHRVASPAKQLQEISFFFQRDQQLARKEGTGSADKVGAHNNKPSSAGDPLGRYQPPSKQELGTFWLRWGRGGGEGLLCHGGDGGALVQPRGNKCSAGSI